MHDTTAATGISQKKHTLRYSLLQQPKHPANTNTFISPHSTTPPTWVYAKRDNTI